MGSGGNKYCDEFLKWALPRMDLSWSGYRNVRGQVCKRIKKRLYELNLVSLDRYREYLESSPSEWHVLDSLARITISRFFRDKKLWDELGDKHLPLMAKEAFLQSRPLRCWSAGCASGEEPYSLAILWRHKILPLYPDLKLELIATDADPYMIKRAREAYYSSGSLKEVPSGWLGRAFYRGNSHYRLKEEYIEMVKFFEQDIREQMPGEEFDLIFCKNLVAMYFKKELAVSVFKNISRRLKKGGLLILGNHEEFPLDEIKDIKELNRGLNLYIKR